MGRRQPTSTTDGSVKISSGVGKAGPLSSLQQAPQPSTHCHKGSFLRSAPKPTELFLCLFSSLGFFDVRHGRFAAELGTVKQATAIDCGIYQIRLFRLGIPSVSQLKFGTFVLVLEFEFFSYQERIKFLIEDDKVLIKILRF